MLLQELIQNLLFSPWRLLFPILFIFLIAIIIILVIDHKEYKNSTYHKITKLPYYTVKHDIGRYGEYLTYKRLKKLEASGAKFLFNVYIPKADGETSEIDVLMICSKGIFVFESKNYSGWIFGSEKQKNWYQTLPTGRGQSHKEHFYNPIMQNRSHIKHLKTFLGEHVPMYSIIVFSDRCTLKNIQIKNNDIPVINRCKVDSIVLTICNKIPSNLLCIDEINNFYNKLYPYTQADAITQSQHIVNIHSKYSKLTTQSTQPVITENSPSPDNTGVAISDITEFVSSTMPNTKSVVQNVDDSLMFKCPKCGGNLILRTATRGINIGKHFYGCSNYPKCKYTQNMI